MYNFNYGLKYGYNSRENYGFNCRICRFELKNMTWNSDERYGLDETCPCYGGQSGLNDDNPQSARFFRKL